MVVTAIHSGTVNNVIPDSCLIKGSSRDFSAASASTITQRLEEIGTMPCDGQRSLEPRHLSLATTNRRYHLQCTPPASASVSRAALTCGTPIRCSSTPRPRPTMLCVLARASLVPIRSLPRTSLCSPPVRTLLPLVRAAPLLGCDPRCSSIATHTHTWPDRSLRLRSAEDFSFFTRAKPGCFFFLGGQEAGRTNAICHSTQYDFNDHCIPLGVALWVRLVEDRFDAQLYD